MKSQITPNKFHLTKTRSPTANPPDTISPQRRRLLLAGSALLGCSSSSILSACGGGGGAASTSTTGGASTGGATASAQSASAGYDGTLAVSGARMINGNGVALQLRGVNVQQQAAQMIVAGQTLGTTGVPDASGGNWVNDQSSTTIGSGSGTTIGTTGPNTAYMKPWKFNVVRVGINEASWLGYTCYRSDGVAVNPDNFGVYPNLSYRNQIVAQVAELNAAGMHAILTLCYTNPGRSCPLGQDAMANQDNSIACWQSIAEVFGFPNGTALKRNGGTVDDRAVVFELYNEPVADDALVYAGGFNSSGYMINGQGFYSLAYTIVNPFPCSTPTKPFIPGETVSVTGGITGKLLCYYENTSTGYAASGTRFVHLHGLSGTAIVTGATVTGMTSGATATITGPTGWYVAGALQLKAAIRAAGAGNICLFSGSNYAKNLKSWLTYAAGSDAAAPAGWDAAQFGAWTSQIGAHWHPYPAFSRISEVTVASGGSGYAVNDTILLLMDESGDSGSGNCYWQTQLKVTSVSNGSVTRASVNSSYVGGTPGVAGGNAGQYGGSGGGVWSNVNLPRQLPQDTAGAQPGTKGKGATFDVTYNDVSANGGGDLSDWDTALAIKAAGYPVVITETGEHTGNGISGSPYMAAMTAWCDANEIGLLCFAYTPAASWYNAKGGDFDLALPTLTGSPPYRAPTPGYGQFMFNWFSKHAA
jgi:hypothetical protein